MGKILLVWLLIFTINPDLVRVSTTLIEQVYLCCQLFYFAKIAFLDSQLQTSQPWSQIVHLTTFSAMQKTNPISVSF